MVLKKLGIAFGLAAVVSTGYVAKEVIYTAEHPQHPSYLGLTILGHYFTKSHYPKYEGPFPYSEYMRDRYLENPTMAYNDLERVYGITHGGDSKETFSKFVKGWLDNSKIPNRSGSENFVFSTDSLNEFDTKSALLMFLSITAYGREVYTIIDAQALCNDILDHNNKIIASSANISSSGKQMIQECKL